MKKGNKESLDVKHDRRKLIKAIPGVAVGITSISQIPTTQAKSVHTEALLQPTVIDKSDIKAGYEFANKLRKKRLDVKTRFIRFANSSILKFSTIDTQDYRAFARGRIDLMGNYVSVQVLASQLEQSNLLKDLSLVQNPSLTLESIKEQLSIELLIFDQLQPFLNAFKNAIQAYEQFIFQRSNLNNFEISISQLNAVNRQLVEKYGSLSNISEHFKAPQIPESWSYMSEQANTTHKFDTGNFNIPNALSSSRKAKIENENCPYEYNECGQFREAGCTSDNIDCGLFDSCQIDECGIGDDSTDCWFYDDGDDCWLEYIS